MTIQKFPPTKAGQDAAFAVPEPRSVMFADGAFYVRTGVDYEAPPVPSKDEADLTTAKEYAKLKALAGMSPDEVRAWVAGNVKDLAAVQDAVTTLAIAVSVLIRRV